VIRAGAVLLLWLLLSTLRTALPPHRLRVLIDDLLERLPAHHPIANTIWAHHDALVASVLVGLRHGGAIVPTMV